jgi:carbon starvation protein CstA
MFSFLGCLAILLIGYFVYGKFVSDTFGPDDRATPAITKEDGVDYVLMPGWRIFLIQLLNIAGLGPIWGALAGALWGPSVFLWITLGTIFAGGVHDFAAGFISMREDGLSISELAGHYMGRGMKMLMRVFTLVLLFMIGVVFAVGPAQLLAYLCGTNGRVSIWTNKNLWLAIVLLYYFAATFFSVDKIIGKVYPLFGACLVMMAVGVGLGIFTHGYTIPEILPLTNRNVSGTAMWPTMFVSVACGAVSGFHSTQSPIMARCCRSEKMSHKIFYGAMVCEGVIALIWAAAGCALFPIVGGKMTGLQGAMAAGQAACIYNICVRTMGASGVVLAMLGVIVCPISSGDTAFRSARLTLADWFGIDQTDWKKRLALSAPLLVLGAVVSQLDYSTIWNYFAFSNQVLATVVLWTASMYLVNTGKQPWIAVVPATFMSAVTATYFLSGQECLGLPATIANPVGVLAAAVFLGVFLVHANKARKTLGDAGEEKEYAVQADGSLQGD